MGSITHIRGHGGAREGAGRPKKSIADRMRETLIKAERKYKRDHGRDVAECLMDIIGSPQQGGQIRVQAIKLFYEVTAGTVKETVHTENRSGPTIYLPEEMEPPDA